jgi:hypothetical protein
MIGAARQHRESRMKQTEDRPHQMRSLMRRVRACALFLVLATGLAAWPAPAHSEQVPEPIPLAPTSVDSVHIGLPPVIPAEEGVRDPVFALLIGLVSSGSYGTLTEERLEQEMQRLPNRSKLPYQSLHSLTRMPIIPGRTGQIRLEFNGDLDLPVPYSILGYHPGSFTASRECLFREWNLGTVRLEHTAEVDGKIKQSTVELREVHLYGVARGKVRIDIDGWLDALLGGMLDDTDVTCLMLCRYQGRWLGFAMGYNDSGDGRSGALTFDTDEILFPSPPELRTVGRMMRKRTEQLMLAWTAPRDPSALPLSGN